VADPNQNNQNGSKPGQKKKANEAKVVDEVFEAPVIVREPTSRQVTLGGKLTLRINATGRPLPSFQWFCNGRKISGANSDRYNVNRTRREHGGAYTCEVKNYAGKVMSRAAMISFLTERVPDIVIEPSIASIPIGKPFKFRVASPGLDVLKRLKLQWTFNGKRINGATGMELQFIQIKKKYEGEYKVVILVAGDIHASNCAKLVALPAEGVADIQPALTKEKTAFIVAPPKEAFFFDPLEEEESPNPAASDPALLRWQQALKAETGEDARLEPMLAEKGPPVAPPELERAITDISLIRKKALLQRLIAKWPARRRVKAA